MIGKTISHYRIAEELGVGGMGVVYLAKDLHLRRLVTLKFLHEKHYQDPQVLQRFRREAHAVSALNHPNICTIHDVDEFEGRLYIVMEYVEGQTLKQMIKGGPLESKRILDLGIQLCAGLDEAHSKGVIHRDIKPSNIMMAHSGHPKILDFGLAKLTEAFLLPISLESTESMESWAAERGNLVGTLPFMSPEQVLGRPLDHRTDLFSLGIVLYELATGERPFQGDTWAALSEEIIHGDPISVLRLNPRLPNGLDAFFKRALEKDRELRFQSASDMKAELSHLKRQIDLSTTPVPVGRRIPSKRGHKNLIRYGLLILLVLVLLFPTTRRMVFDFFWIEGSPPIEYVAVLPFQILGQSNDAQRAFCDGMAGRISHVLLSSESYQENLRVIPFSDLNRARVTTAVEARDNWGATLVVEVLVEFVAERIDLSIGLIETSEVNHYVSNTQIQGQIREAKALRDQAVAALVPMLRMSFQFGEIGVLAQGIPSVSSAYSHLLEGEGYLARHDYAENLDKAEEAFLKALEVDDGYALAFARLGETYRLKFKEKNDPALIVSAEKQILKALELEPMLPRVHAELGRVFRERGEYEEALVKFDDALELDSRNADAYRGAAATLERLGDLEGAEVRFREAIDLRPGYWLTHHELASFFRRHNRHQEALTEWEMMREIIPDSAAAYNNLAGVYLDLQQWDEAERLFKVSIRMQPTQHQYNNLARIYFFNKRYDEAVAAWEEALEYSDNDHVILQGMGVAYEQIGRKEEALKYYERAARNAEEQLLVDSRNPKLKADLAHYLSRIGEGERAISYMTEALEVWPDNPWILAAAGAMYERLGHRELAVEHTLKAIEQGYAVAELREWPTLKDLFADGEFSRRVREIEDRRAADTR